MATYASSIPQPKSFAPSREDVLNTLAFFFGAPVSPEKLKGTPPIPSEQTHAIFVSQS